MSDSLETAVIAMVLEGDALVSQKSNRVTADLSSAERAGRAAEGAAKGAESSVRSFSQQVGDLSGKMHLAIRLAERLTHLAGVDSPGLDAVREGSSVGFATLRFLGATPLAPLAVPLAAAAGLFAGVSSYEKSQADEQKKADEQADRIAKRIAEEQHKRLENDLSAQLVRQAAASHLDNILAGSRRVP